MKTLFWFPKKGSSFFWLRLLFVLSFYGGIMGVLAVISILYYYAGQVPDYRQLADYRPELITKVYDRHGDLLAEYARQRRIYVPIDEIPDDVKQTFLAAEDTEFYKHSGFDPIGILRAAYVNIFTSRKQGASTITQQVAKTFLLTRERTYTRKIKELILAYRIEQAFSKDKILELYLNRIYLGSGAYGVAAAALAYYDKSLDELTIGQRAMLAGLPKAPSYYNPIQNPQQARFRRDVILGRMERENLISEVQRQEITETDLELNPRRLASGNDAPHFSEHVRRYLEKSYGADTLYEGGLSVFTTLDKSYQSHAEDAMYKGLREYDRRHGYRGPLARVNLLLNWQQRIDDETKAYKDKSRIGKPAIVLDIDDKNGLAEIGLAGNSKGYIPLQRLKWARDYIDADTKGPKVKKVSDVLREGDIVLVHPVGKTLDYNAEKEKATHADGITFYSLEQTPKIQGALVALDVRTGAVLAMVGGLGGGTGFNRAVQAERQSGSAIKPFVYSLALEEGYTASSIILDAPVVMRSAEDDDWKPQNYSEKVYGPSTFRRGLEQSRNLMTIRLARDLGLQNIRNYTSKFGLQLKKEHGLSAALGSVSVSLLSLTSAYGVFPNQGIYVPPYFIDSIQDATGSVAYSHYTNCVECNEEPINAVYQPPFIEPKGQRVMPETTAYLMNYLMQGIVQYGTAWRAKAIPQPTGAKTGTTNDFIDAWLMGFAPNMAIGVWVGFDQPQTMGKNESGSKAAGPIWVDFAKKALENKQLKFDVPEGITFVRVDAETGELPTSTTKKRILEAFEAGTEPTRGGVMKRPSQADTGGYAVEFQGLY